MKTRKLHHLFVVFFCVGIACQLHAAQLISERNTSIPLAAAGNGDSVAPSISRDGRFVLFSSTAGDLVTNDNSRLAMDVFLYDRISQRTVLISANRDGMGGGDDHSSAGQVSTNGLYVVFESAASDLVAGDTNGARDIFVRDVAAGTNILVSVAVDGGPANGASSGPMMTPDGRYVAFISAATNLVAGDTNRNPDVFVRDVILGTTVMASVGASGLNSAVATPVLTPDGRYVAFFSTATNLAGDGSASTLGEIYVRDLVSNITTWPSTNASLTVSNLFWFGSGVRSLPSFHPAISDDGRFVAFKTGRTNGVAWSNSPSAATVIFRYDALDGSDAILTTNGYPMSPFNDDVLGPEMTPDGRFIAFVETNREAAACAVVQLWDALDGTNTIVNVALDGGLPTNSYSCSPAVSADGRFVVFMSNAANLTGNALSNGMHIFLRDLQSGTTQLVDVDTNGIGSVGAAGAAPGLSDDGQRVVFSAPDGSLVAGDINRATDVFMRDTTGGTSQLISARDVHLVSVSASGVPSLGQFSMSDDGRRIAFASYAEDLVAGDTNGAADVFVYDLDTGTIQLASVGADGGPALGGDSFGPALSGDGRTLVFVSGANNLVAGGTNYYLNIYIRDLEAGTNDLVSVGVNGSPGNGDASAPVVSYDGRIVVFLSKASNLVLGVGTTGPNTFWRDISSGQTAALSTNVAFTVPPSMSADGRFVAYYGSSSQFWVRDTWANRNIYTNASALPNPAVLSPSGTRLLFNSAGKLSVVDLTTQSNLVSISTTVSLRNPGAWSADGRSFTFVTKSNAVPVDTNGTNDVYVCDVDTGALTLVSHAAAGITGGNGPSDWPVLSGDGRFVIYRSLATDIAPGIGVTPNLFVFDRFTGSNSLLTASSALSWSSWVMKPAVSGDGKRVAFQSWNPGLAPGDLNRSADVFAAALSPWGDTDTDGDGIPDLWLTHFFGHPTGQAGDLSLAGDDADGDGMTTLEEYLAGTDPTDPTSVLRAEIRAAVMDAGTVTLTWRAVPGRNYRVQVKGDLSDPAWADVPEGTLVVGTEGSITFTADAVQRFYRVVLE